VSSEARRSPRYLRQLDVDIDGLEIVTANVALGGVQLCCPEMRYAGFQRADDDGQMKLRIRMPGTQHWLRPTGRTRYADLCEDEYLIGFQFTDFDEGDEDHWTAYLESLAGAKPNA